MMKSSALFAADRPWTLQVFGLLSLAAILAAVDRNLPALGAAPFVMLILPVLLFAPQVIPFVFLLSFYWGRFLIDRHFVGAVVTDLTVVLFLIGYASKFLVGSAPLSAPPVNTRIWRPLALLAAWCVVSFLANIYAYDSVQITVSMWWLLRCAQMVLVYRISRDALSDIPSDMIINLVLLLSILQLPVTLWQYFLGPSGSYLEARQYVVGTMTYHHSMLGSMMLIPMAFCLYRFLDTGAMAKRLFYAVVGVSCLFVIIISGSRSALLGLGGAGLVLAITQFKLKASYFAYVLSSIAVVAVLLIWSPLGEAVSATFFPKDAPVLDVSTASRLLVWEGAVAYFQNMSIWEKLVGVGIGGYFTVPYDFVIWKGLRHAVGAHNNALHVLLETGLIGLALFAWLFVEILRALWRRARASRLAFSFFYLTVALLFSGLAQETFWFQKAFASFWMFFMIMLVIALREETVQPAGSPAGI